MTLRPAIAVAALALAACAMPQPRGQSMMSSARATCIAAGFRDGSPELAQCTMQGYRQAQAQMNRPSPYGMPASALRTAPQPTTTVCTPSGGSMFCTSQ